MAITLQGANPKIGFKYSDNNTSKGTDTMTIAKNGKLLFNGTRLGLTPVEIEYLQEAVNKKLLTNASISLSASPNPYEKKNTDDDTYISSVTFTLTLKVNNKIATIVDEKGNDKTSIQVQITDDKGSKHNITLTKGQGTLPYTATVKMNKGLAASGNNIANFISGTCVVNETIYCNITKDGETYTLPLSKPSLSVTPAGLIYSGVTNKAGLLPTDNQGVVLSNVTIGAIGFKNYTPGGSKGSLTIDVGIIKSNQFYVGTNEGANTKIEPTTLNCLDLKTSASGTTITLKEPTSQPYYGIVILPNTINLGKFANGVVDSSVHGGKVYNATNTATNMDSPFILLSSTNFAACTHADPTNDIIIPSELINKKVVYNIYRTKNKLTNPITIRL